MTNKVKKIPNPTPDFEEFAIEINGAKFWSGKWFAKILEYSSLQTLYPNIKKAENLAARLGFRLEDHFYSKKSNRPHDTYLSKIACFLISLEADARKPVVKRARSYFLQVFHELDQLLTNEEYLERISEREILKKLNTRLAKVARRAHVKDFQYFINEGYLGMYGLTVGELKTKRELSQKENLYDHMCFDELAAHIFRISSIISKLSRLRNPSEIIASREHRKIGKYINKIMSESFGKSPENFKGKTGLSQLKKQLNVMNKSLSSHQSLSKSLET